MKKHVDYDENYTEKKGNGFKIFLVILLLTVIGVGTFTGFYLYEAKGGNTKQDKVYVSLGDVMVNLADEGGKRYFKGNVSVAYNKGDSTAKKQLTKEKQLVVVADAINFYIKGKTSDFVINDDGTQMKKELIETINKNIQGFKITDIRFSNIVVQ